MKQQAEKRQQPLTKSEIREMGASHQKLYQKQQETESFKNALGIKGDYTEGSAFDRELQGNFIIFILVGGISDAFIS